jgi:hypothetical protein
MTFTLSFMTSSVQSSLPTPGVHLKVPLRSRLLCRCHSIFSRLVSSPSVYRLQRPDDGAEEDATHALGRVNLDRSVPKINTQEFRSELAAGLSGFIELKRS